MEFKGLSNIDDYLASRGDGCPIDVSELDHIVESLVAYCGLTKEQSKRIIALFFQEIRFAMLSGKRVNITGFGSFFVSSPKVTNNLIRIFPKFKTKKSLIKRLNNER